MPFLTTSTGSSADDSVGLLHPTTDHGVRLVSGRSTTSPPLPDHSHRRCTLRRFSLLARLASSPSHCWAVHRTPCPSRGWLSSSSNTTETALFFERSPHLRGVRARSPLLASGVATAGPPDPPLGFPRLRAFTRRLAGDGVHRNAHPPVRGPTETGTLQTMTPPKRTHRTDELVALEPFHRRSCSRSRRRDDAGSRDRTHGFPCAPPMPKHRPGAAAFQGPPLPMGAVTCGDEPPVSVGALAEASRRAEAFRHRVSSLTSP
jgi:hypothetical protein